MEPTPTEEKLTLAQNILISVFLLILVLIGFWIGRYTVKPKIKLVAVPQIQEVETCEGKSDNMTLRRRIYFYQQAEKLCGVDNVTQTDIGPECKDYSRAKAVDAKYQML